MRGHCGSSIGKKKAREREKWQSQRDQKKGVRRSSVVKGFKGWAILLQFS
jgi:hypothetical protein